MRRSLLGGSREPPPERTLSVLGGRISDAPLASRRLKRAALRMNLIIQRRSRIAFRLRKQRRGSPAHLHGKCKALRATSTSLSPRPDRLTITMASLGKWRANWQA
ncbi:hypothetical protein HRbin17_02299 [bacterium HR17]|uniref:Uncharacterized protein n=1 Tax=Candidatus Fervidibacter japonicus TaxID=2035412 RepID=A0A2H5XEZ6_9BACT|nr:hypothetical protein HRbin17_02299 [bacterium HR17]